MAATKNPETRRRRQRNQRKRALPQIKALQEELLQRFPSAFFLEPDKVTPLKTGIRYDIQAAFTDCPYSSRIIGWTLHRYTRRYTYLQALAERKPRIDLSGTVVGTVTEEEQQQAIAELKTKSRQRGKARKPVRADEQPGGESPVSDVSGETVTEEQVGTATEDQKESQPTTAQRKPASKRRVQSGKGDKAKDQPEESPLSSGTPVDTVTNDKQKASARRKTTKKRSGKSDNVAKMKE